GILFGGWVQESTLIMAPIVAAVSLCAFLLIILLDKVDYVDFYSLFKVMGVVSAVIVPLCLIAIFMGKASVWGLIVSLVLIVFGVFSLDKDLCVIQDLSDDGDVSSEYEWFFAGTLMIELFVIIAAIGHGADRKDEN
ncbi:hypothetical protein ACFQY8_00450, partial [Alloscardovia venturai]